MLLRTFIRILTSLIRDFCTSDRNFASTFFQIPPHDGHPWSWLVVGHCDHNPHNRLSLSRYMPCPAYVTGKPHQFTRFFYAFYLTMGSILEVSVRMVCPSCKKRRPSSKAPASKYICDYISDA